MPWIPKGNLKGEPGYNATGAVQDIETLAAYARAAAGPNEFATALAATIGESAVKVNVEASGRYPARPSARVVAWVGVSNPNDFMGPNDYWVNLAEPPALSFADIRAELLSPGSALAAAAATAAAAKALLWVPAAQFVASIAAPTLNGAPSAYLSSAPVWRLDPNITEGVSASVVIPAGWGTAQATLYWMSLGTSGGSVRTVVNMNSLVPGAQVSDATQALEFNMVAPTTSGAVDAYTPPTSNSFNVNPDRPLRITAARRADHASDTNTDDIGIVGLMLRRLT